MSENQRHWYAVHTRVNCEHIAAKSLAARAVETYCPIFEEIHRWADRRKFVNCPVFPGYVFVRIGQSPEERLNVLKSRGAVRILGIGSAIEPVPDREIESIRVMLQSRAYCSRYPFLSEGARVRVRCGPLKDLTGILIRFKNRTRLVISVQLLQQAVAADIDAGDVEVLDAAREAEPPAIVQRAGAVHVPAS
jgi:transcriptional antiterminator NusG